MKNNRQTKRILAVVSAAAITAVAASSLCACNSAKTNGYACSYIAMDTGARLAAANINKSDFSRLAARVGNLLSDTENSLSTARSNSYVCKFNAAPAGTRVEVDKTFYEVLTLAKEVYTETDGYFNPAVYYSEDIYGFAARPADSLAMPYDRQGDGKTLPDEKYVTAFQELSTHFSEVEIFELDGTYYATKPEYTAKIEGDSNEYSLALDLGGIAKGWCVDRVNEVLADAGVEHGYFNFGSSSVGVKKTTGGDGKYSVTTGDPRNLSDSYMSFKVQDDNFSTSADDRNFYMIDGTRYCHIISPVTGSPVRTGIASVTLVGGSAGRTDALTTALTAMGKERAAEFINSKLSASKVIMLEFLDGAGKIITNAPDYFTVLNKNYVLACTVEDGKIALN